MSEVLEVKINESIKDISYTIDFEDCYDNGYILKNNEGKIHEVWISKNVTYIFKIIFFSSGIVSVEEASATSWVITPLGLYSYKDRVNKPENGKPMVRSVIYLESESNATLKLLRKDENETVVSIPVSFHFSESELKEIEDPSEYDVYLDETLLDKNVPFKSGGVYTVVGSKVMYNNKPKILGKTVTVTPPNSLHMAWMLPQYIIITMAEVMFSVTGLQFAFTQAPASMKSLLQAGWLLSVAFGNLIVVIVKGSHPFERLVSDQTNYIFYFFLSHSHSHPLFIFKTFCECFLNF